MIRDEIEAHEAALGYHYAREKLMRLSRRVGEHALEFTGDGETLGLVYKDGNEVVFWGGGVTCIVTSPNAPSRVFHLAKTLRGHRGVTQRMLSKADIVCQALVDDYRSTISAQVA